jgi:nitrogen-specific signal transduction histidine kinase
LAVVAAWFLFEAARERRARIRADIEKSAELNHEIRNALEVIGHAGYLLNDVVYGSAVAESVDRIKKSLDRSKPES